MMGDVRQRLTSLSSRYAPSYAAVVAMVVTVTLGVPPEPTLLWNAVFDVGHAVVFAAITVILLDLVARRQAEPNPRAVVGWTVAVALALAAGTELLQTLEPSHDADVRDFVRDATGMTLALLLRRTGPSPHISAARRVTAALIAMTVLAPLLAVAGIYLQRNRAVPVVIPMHGSWWERRLQSFRDAEVVAGACEAGSTGTEPLVRLLFQPARYPGFYFKEPYPDWRAFQRLVFRAAADADRPITLVLRIDDARQDERQGDRFIVTLAITPGAHRIEIPLDTVRPARPDPAMDLARIRGIGVYAHQIGRPQHVCLSAFRLE
jgi:hypothetical protein